MQHVWTRPAALAAALALAFAGTAASAREANEDDAFASIATLRQAYASGALTPEGLTTLFLQRIERIDKSGPSVNAVLETNPDALAIARKADRKGSLGGIPILLKDNIDTGDRMLTTAGSLALATKPAPHDSAVAAKLRKAGAVVLGKTNLSEWANMRSNHATSGWTGRVGLTLNPYVLDRNACGSSAGSGAAVAVGTETDGSIVSPSSANSLVGIKPTVGLVSR
ncbi:MAG: amidase family protein, partial [Luteibacter sp.]